MTTVLLVFSEAQARRLLSQALRALGFKPVILPEEAWERPPTDVFLEYEPDLVLADTTALEAPVINGLAEHCLQVPFLLFTEHADDPKVLKRAMRLGAIDVLEPPVQSSQLAGVLRRALARKQAVHQWAAHEAERDTLMLRSQIDELHTLLRVGRTLTAKLDLDETLAAVVNAAVEFTGAEESTLLLLDEETGELYLRASRNFEARTASTLRLKVQDTLAGEVVRTGKPVLLERDVPEKIKTAYLVHSLIYVPLYIHGRVIGVLGVDNRQRRGYFTQRHVERLTALAEYAAVALDNAQLFTAANAERRRLETVLNNIEDGIVVLNPNGEAIIINRVARQALDIDPHLSVLGRQYTEFCPDRDLEAGIREALDGHEFHTEITAPDGRVFSLQAVPIPEVGVAITLHDVTHFKELDRIKNEFVSAVSHDLRSPLTAILGYVELLERAGPLNDTQKEFVKRVRLSVENITALINDLLDLGRIEAGFDLEKEVVSIVSVLRYAIESGREQAEKKGVCFHSMVEENLPTVFGNAVRLRQMLDNIIGNAVKYTPIGGCVTVTAEGRGQQVIIRISDTGPGIPPSEQPYIFNKFFRGSNVASETSGTGLGLAIVKSIIESHHGRVWVESEVGKGTTFTVVLPGLEEDTVAEFGKP